MIQTPGKHQPKKIRANRGALGLERDCMSGVSSNLIDPLPGLGNVREGVFAKSKSYLTLPVLHPNPRSTPGRTIHWYFSDIFEPNATSFILASISYQDELSTFLFFTYLFIPDRSSATCVSIVLDFLRFFWVMTFDMFLQRNQLHLFF